jgi:HK97 family phage prohead protease
MLAPQHDLARPTMAIAPDGTVEGYASLFGEIDQARDMVMPGAFAASLKTRGVRRVPMLFQHDPAEPVGVWLELREDWRGLYARGRLIPEVVRARELLALLKAGTADGLSIGFRTVKGRIDPKTRVRKLVEIDLWEISIVTFPLLPGARIRAVKKAPSRLSVHARTRNSRVMGVSFRTRPGIGA